MTQLLVAQPGQVGRPAGGGGHGGRVRGQAAPVARLGQQAPRLRMASEQAADQSAGGLQPGGAGFVVVDGGHTQQSVRPPRPDIDVRSGGGRPSSG